MSCRSWFLSFMVLVPFAPSFAGVGSSGGGVAVVCRNGEEIERAELLDLYEGRTLYGINYFKSTGTLELDYANARERVYELIGSPDRPSRETSIRVVRAFLRNAHFTKVGERLPWLGDTGRTVEPPIGCELEQLAIYDDATGSIAIDLEIWSALSPLDQAALVAHEYQYASERFGSVPTSQYTRAIVAQGFSAPGAIVGSVERIAPGSFKCVSGPGSPVEFFVTNSIRDGEPMTTLTFFSIGGRGVLALTQAKLRGLRWNTIRRSKHTVADPSGRTFRFRGYLDAPWSPEISIDLIYEPGKPIRIALMDAGGVLVDDTVQFCR